MVLTEDEYREAKSNSRLSSLFNLRKVTKSYIIQCLADREIQRSINNLGQQSKAYGYNCKVVHSPEKYANHKHCIMLCASQVEAVLHVSGWDSANNKPCKPRILPHLSAGSFVSKVQISARIQQLEALVASKEREILYFEESNKCLERKLNNTLSLVDRLKREKNILMISVKNNKKPTNRNTRMDWIMYDDPYFISYPPENNGYYPTYKSVSNVPYKGKTPRRPSDASSKMNFQNLLISTGICLIVYKKPELVHWVLKKLVGLSRTISVYSLLSFRKIFTWSIFLVDIPLNVLATK